MNCTPLMFVINRLYTDRIITSFFKHQRHSCELDYNSRYKRHALGITPRLLCTTFLSIMLCLLSWMNDSNRGSATEIYTKWVPHVQSLLQPMQSNGKSLQPTELCMFYTMCNLISSAITVIYNNKKRDLKNKPLMISHISFHQGSEMVMLNTFLLVYFNMVKWSFFFCDR